MLLCPHCGRPHVGLGLPSDALSNSYEQQEAADEMVRPTNWTLVAVISGASVVGGVAGYCTTRYAIGAKSTAARVAGTAVGAGVAGAGTLGVMALNFYPGRY